MNDDELRLDWDALIAQEQEQLDIAADEAGARLADAYRRLYRRGEITRAELAKVLAALDGATEGASA